MRSPKTLIFDVEETALCKARKQPKRSDVHGRHQSWYEKGALKLLREHDVALCLSDHRQAPAPWIATASHVYVRGHGPDGRYRGHYPDQTLKTWARAIRKWNRQGKTVYVYFDNDQKSAAPTDARRLQSLLATRQVHSAKRFAHA